MATASSERDKMRMFLVTCYPCIRPCSNFDLTSFTLQRIPFYPPSHSRIIILPATDLGESIPEVESELEPRHSQPFFSSAPTLANSSSLEPNKSLRAVASVSASSAARRKDSIVDSFSANWEERREALASSASYELSWRNVKYQMIIRRRCFQGMGEKRCFFYEWMVGWVHNNTFLWKSKKSGDIANSSLRKLTISKE